MNFNKKGQQIIRLDKIYNDDLYLLNKEEEQNKLVFDISGSTKNIYKVQIYFGCKKIFCNCPDAKSWAKKYDVICKHSCFVLFKVLKLKENVQDFFESLVLNESQIEHIKNTFSKITNNEDFINKELSIRFEKIKNDEHGKKIDSNKSQENDAFCSICYDEFENILDINENQQCKVCNQIFHKKCLNKWFTMGNNNCPFCRSILNFNNGEYKNLFSN